MTDADALDKFTYALVDDAGGAFTINTATGAITVADATKLDHETAATLDITVRVTDAGGQSYDEAFTLDINDINEAPTDLVVGLSATTSPVSAADAAGLTFDGLTGRVVVENSADSSLDIAGSMTIEATFIWDDADATDGEIIINKESSYEVAVFADGHLKYAFMQDGGSWVWIDTGYYVTAGEPTSISLVADTGTATTALYVNGGLVADGLYGVTAFASTDYDVWIGDRSQSSTLAGLYSSGANFHGTIQSVRVWNTALAAGEVNVDTVDGSHPHAADLLVDFDFTGVSGATVADLTGNFTGQLQEGVAPATTIVVAESAAGGTLVANLFAVDEDAGETFTFAIASDPSGFFEIDPATGAVSLAAGAALDHETADGYDIVVTATDSGGAVYQETVHVTVTDINEAPTVTIVPAAASFAETTAPGTVLATIAIVDPDAGDSHTYALTGWGADHFEIVDNAGTLELRLRADAILDYEAMAGRTVSVTVTDSWGVSASYSTTISIADTNEAPVLDLVPTSGDYTVGVAETAGSVLFSDVSYYSTTALADGGYVVAWETKGDADGSSKILIQRFDASSNAIGSPAVAFETTQNIDNVALTQLADGTIVLAGQINVIDGNGWGIGVRQYDADLTPQGSTVTVNTFATSTQAAPDITALSDGSYVVVWHSYAQDGDNYGIFGQRFAADGSKLGSEFQINEVIASSQQNPSVTGLAGGGYVVTWTSNGQDGSSWGVYTRIYANDGTPVTGEFVAASTTLNAQYWPQVVSLPDGGYAVVFQSSGHAAEDTGYGVYARFFNADGTARGDEVHVNTTVDSNQDAVEATALADGGLFVVWRSYAADGTTDIYAQRLDASGNPVGAEILLSDDQGYQNLPEVIQLADGTIIATWDSNATGDATRGIHRVEIDPGTGTVTGKTTLTYEVNQNAPAPDVAALEGGGHVVTWTSVDLTGSGWDIMARLFDADGNPVGDTFRVNTNVSSTQYQPSVTTLPDGGFAVAYASYNFDGNSYGVVVQRFDDLGNRIGDEVLVNSYSTNIQYNPSVAALPDGSLVVTWSSFLQDGDHYGVYARVIAADGTPVTAEIAVNNLNTTSAQQDSRVTVLADGRFIVTFETATGTATGDTSGYSVDARIFAADGTPVTDEFRLNSYTGSQQLNPEIAALADGGFVVVYDSYQTEGAFGNSYGIYAEIFDANGNHVSGQIAVSPANGVFDQEADVTALADGGFFVVWHQSYGSATTDNKVFGQRFDATGAAVGGAVDLGSGIEGDQRYPAVTETADGDIVVVWFGLGEGSSHDAINQIVISPTTVFSEDTAPGATIAVIDAFDPDAGDSLTYTLLDGGVPTANHPLFEIVDNAGTIELRLKAGASFDDETSPTETVTVRVTDAAGNSTDRTLTIDIADGWDAPTDLTVADGLRLNDGVTNQYAAISNFVDMPTSTFTVEVSFASDGMPGAGMPLLSYNAEGEDNEVLLYVTGAAGMSAFINGHNEPLGIPASEIIDGSQHQVSLTWDAPSGVMTVYIDGVERYSTTLDGHLAITAGGTLVFGQEQDTVGGGFNASQIFDGTIYEVRIFDDVRTAQEIADNANSPIADPASEPGLVADWQMTPNGTGGIADLAGGHDLVLYNGAALATSVAVNENTANGEHVAYVADVVDSDAGDSFTYSLLDDAGGAFAINAATGEITVADSARLDYETAQTMNITVRITDAGGLTYDEVVTVNIADVVETITGTAGNDTLYGGIGRDVMLGLGGNDNFYGSAGADSFDGGTGTDGVRYTNSTQGLTINLTTGDATGDAAGDTYLNIDKVFGSSYGDVITGGSGVQFLLGEGGNDVITGSSADERIYGGSGADTLDGGDGVDWLRYSDGSPAGITLDLATNTVSGGHADGDVFSNFEAYEGSVYGDVMTGSSGSDFLMGYFGSDTVSGGDGDDTLYGDYVYDTDSSGQADTIDGGAGNDTIYGQGGDDIILGGTGNDTILAGGGNDTITGGAGNDTIDGGAVTGASTALALAAGDDSVHLDGLGVDTADGASNTVEFWMNWDGGENQVPFGFGWYTLWFYNGSFGFSTGATDIYGIDSSSLVGSWHHVSAVFVNGDVAASKLYIDGVEQNLSQLMGSPNDGSAVATTDARISGKTTFTGNKFGGDIAEVRIWNDERTAAEIADTYDEHLTQGDGLVAAYDFENMTDGTDGVIDISGNGADGTLVGITATTVTTGPTLTDPGNDVAVFSGNRADYTITYDAGTDTYTIVDNRAGSPDGTDTVTGIETFQFADSIVDATAPAAVINLAPTDISFTAGVSGAPEVATVTGADPEGDTLSYSLVDDAGGLFTIDAATGRLSYSGSLDPAAVEAHDITIRVSDPHGATYDEVMTVTVGTSGDDNIVGTARDDLILGGDGYDTITGGAGDDMIVRDVGDATDPLFDIGIVSRGYDVAAGGSFINLNGTSYQTSRGYQIMVIDESGNLVARQQFDPYASAANATAMATFLDSIANGNYIAISTHDEPYTNVYDNPTLLAAMDRVGIDTTLIQSMEFRGSYQFLGHLRDDGTTVTVTEDVEPRYADPIIYSDTVLEDVHADIDGGDGTDTVDYSSATAGINVDLGAGTAAVGNWRSDTIVNVENVNGTSHDDVIIGDAGDNIFLGNGGDDILVGGDGNDILVAGDAVTSAARGLVFDGTDDKIDLNNLNVDNTTGAQTTVEFWMYWDGTGNQMPIGFYDGTYKYDLYFIGDKFGFNTGNFDVYGVYSTGLAGGWHHVAAVFTNGDVTQNKLYIDGVSRSLSQLQGTPITSRVGADMTISGWPADNSTLFDGQLADVRVWDGARSAAEVADDMNTPVTADDTGSPNLVASYALTGGDYTDYSGNGDDGIAIGNPDTTLSANPLPGVLGGSVLDGGAGDDVLVGGSGTDTIDGGTGNDTVSYENSDAGVTVNLTTGVHAGGDADGDSIANVDNIIGSDHNDSLTGNADANTFTGGLGNDTVTGGDGADLLLYGLGDGNDTYQAGAGGGWVDAIEITGGDSLFVASTSTSYQATDWTLTLTQGTITATDADHLTLSDDADGTITFTDGSTVQFYDVERVDW
ncbi:MAG: LamG-like jellyroll fold domain-containing protein [Hyphomicrobiales bacterium]